MLIGRQKLYAKNILTLPKESENMKSELAQQCENVY